MGRTKYLNAFERGMVVGASRTSMSVSRTVKLLGFSRSTVSRMYR
jgi:IS30 family transposase